MHCVWAKKTRMEWKLFSYEGIYPPSPLQKKDDKIVLKEVKDHENWGMKNVFILTREHGSIKSYKLYTHTRHHHIFIISVRCA